MIYSEADIKPQWAHVAKITTEKCFLNDKMILAAASPQLALALCILQHRRPVKHSKVSLHIKMKIFFDNISLPFPEQSCLKTISVQQTFACTH